MIDIKSVLKEYKTYLVLRNFQPATLQMYGRTLELFLSYCNLYFPEEPLAEEHAQQYLLLRIEKGKAWSIINVDYSALRKYYKVVKDYPWNLRKLLRPKKDKRLPDIISKEEVGRFIQSAPTLKHQVFLTFLYATGARLSEANHIKIEDIDSKCMPWANHASIRRKIYQILQSSNRSY